MKAFKIAVPGAVVMLVYACSHPIQIVGEGDVTSSGGRVCTLENFLAADDVCEKNYVLGLQDYTDTYTATARAGWQFDHWVNCSYANISVEAGNTCSFSVPASAVQAYWGKTVPPLQAVFSDCTLNSPGDADGDRLPDCVETNTNVYVSTTNTGTNPNIADTDGDSIDDGDEVLGTLGGLALNQMGVNPLRKDILVEYDWFDDSLECGAHSHIPTANALALVTTSFANSTVTNPDGSTGVNFIHDYGQGGVFTGGNNIADADGVLTGGVNSTEFKNHKLANFNANRNGYFHYTILPHRYDTNSTSSGQAELSGDDMIVSLYCYGSDINVANTIQHELGHNLNLRHGGFEDKNNKPNYNSVMNYNYQFPGVDTNCTPPGDGRLDYSRGTRIVLNEFSLDENQGTCGNPPGPGWDWNGNGGAFEVGVVADINFDGLFQALSDYDDWANMQFTGLADADGALPFAPQIIDCTNPPPPI
jgi:hypothetical protein